MAIEQISLTPELAAELLARPHPRQRRPAPGTVRTYSRAIAEGRWRLVPDPVLVTPDGLLFNGAHRCAAVVATSIAIPVFIDRAGDDAMFDVLDIGLRRTAHQFIRESDASRRAAAARLTLWYERRFDQPPIPRNLAWDLHEILEEVERRTPAFDAMMPAARATYGYTSLSESVCLAAYAIAHELGFQTDVDTFVGNVEDPAELDAGHPARQLSDRFRKQIHRGRRRRPVEDWTLLVRSLNLAIEGKLGRERLQLSALWPRVGETLKDYDRRRNVAMQLAYKAAHRDEVREKDRVKHTDRRAANAAAAAAV